MRKRALVAGLVAAALFALAEGTTEQKMKGEIAQLMGQSLKSLPGYSYQQRTEIRLKGEEKGVTLVQVAFGPNGQPMVTPLSQSAPDGGRKRGVRGAIQKEAAADVKGQVEDLVKLASSYEVLDKARIQDLMARSVLELVPSKNAVKLTVANFLQPGDHATYKYDAQTMRQTHLAVTTTLGGSPVTIEGIYHTLPSGLTYAVETSISMPAKDLVVVVNTLNYVKQ